MMLFTDGSVNTKTNIGFGAYLLVKDESSRPSPKDVQTQKFTNTSSTRLELECLLWAIAAIPQNASPLTVYTDSQNIVHLPERRASLEKSQYISGKGTLLNNHNLYQQFYQLQDSRPFTLVKIKGHKKSAQKSTLDEWFALVDKAARMALREEYE